MKSGRPYPSFARLPPDDVCCDNSHAVGVIPLVGMRSALFGNVACSMPFVNYGGQYGLTDAIERELLAATAAVVDDWKNDDLEIRRRHDLGERYPGSLHNVRMTIELDPDPDVVGRMKREHRQDIRRTLKRGFVARFGHEYLEDHRRHHLRRSSKDSSAETFTRTWNAEAKLLYWHFIARSMP